MSNVLINKIKSRKERIEKEKADTKAQVVALINKRWTNAELIIYSNEEANRRPVGQTLGEYDCKYHLLSRYHKLFDAFELADLKIIIEKQEKERIESLSASNYGSR